MTQQKQIVIDWQGISWPCTFTLLWLSNDQPGLFAEVSDALLARYQEDYALLQACEENGFDIGIEKSRRLLRLFRAITDTMIDDACALLRNAVPPLTLSGLRFVLEKNRFTVTTLAVGLWRLYMLDRDGLFDDIIPACRRITQENYRDTGHHENDITGRNTLFAAELRKMAQDRGWTDIVDWIDQTLAGKDGAFYFSAYIAPFPPGSLPPLSVA